MISNPIFIIGTERSGSNLLRLLLHAHPSIAIPHPPHLMRDMKPLVNGYGDLRQAKNFEALARDVARLVNLHFAPWPFEIEVPELLLHAPTQSLYGLYVALYELYRLRSKKPRWGCKSTFMYQEIANILELHSSPRLIHLVRDPRDVAASAENSIFSHYHPFKEAQLWRDQQLEIERWSHLISAGKMIRVRYEDLVSRPESELKRVMKFLNEDYFASQLQYFRGQEAATLSELSQSWKNCASPISNQSVGKYRSQLDESDVALVEDQTGELMSQYGYRRETEGASIKLGRLDRLRIESMDHLRKMRMETQALLHDRNFYRRWRKWFFVQYIKHSRSLLNGSST